MTDTTSGKPLPSGVSLHRRPQLGQHREPSADGPCYCCWAQSSPEFMYQNLKATWAFSLYAAHTTGERIYKSLSKNSSWLSSLKHIVLSRSTQRHLGESYPVLHHLLLIPLVQELPDKEDASMKGNWCSEKRRDHIKSHHFSAADFQAPVGCVVPMRPRHLCFPTFIIASRLSVALSSSLNLPFPIPSTVKGWQGGLPAPWLVQD